MKRLETLLFAALLAGALHAQNLKGTWQGTLKPGPQDLRIVIKISLDDDKLKAVMYSIDQGAQPFNANSITQDGPAVKVAITALGGFYEGKLSPDGNTITGTWTQGAPLPLTLTRTTPQTEWTIPEPPPPAKPMAPDAKPQFEVATIKPTKPDERRFAITVNRSGMLNSINTSTTDLIKFAYGVHPRQITRGPAWMETEKFDVTAKPDTEGIPNPTQLKAMLQKLLADRFQLAFHREKKELSVYAITVAKTGAKITKSEVNGNLPGFGRGPRALIVRNATMAQFANMLQESLLEQPVVDQTGFGENRYDFKVDFTPDPSQLPPGAPAPPPLPAGTDAPPDFFTALQQQIGLKLESTKAPVDVLIIDKVEKPSEN